MTMTEQRFSSPTPGDLIRTGQVMAFKEPTPYVDHFKTQDVDLDAEKPEMPTEEIDLLIDGLEDKLGRNSDPALVSTPDIDPASIKEPTFNTRAIDLGSVALPNQVHVKVAQEPSKPQAVTVVHAPTEPAPAKPVEVAPPAPAEAKAKDPDPAETIDIPDDVVVEVAAKVSRKDFVKQQEELFGANDVIKPEDVPEGELTYEQYLAGRPVAEKSDFYHHNGRVYNAVPGEPMQNKKEIYEAQRDATSAEEHYEKVEIEASQVEAIEVDKTKDRAYDEIIRSNTEGEILVKTDPRLRGLLAVSQELQALYNSKLTGEEFEKTIKPALEAKKAIYDDLFKLYKNDGAIDERALGFISDKTESIDDPDFIPVEGSPFINGEKVDILDLTETLDGNKAYTVEKADGSIEEVNSDKVRFRREFEKYEAPEEEKLSIFERTKKWFSKERKKIQEYGGLVYMRAAFTGALGRAGEWLTNRHITDEMTPEQVQAQKLVNRRNNILGLAAGVAVGIIAQRTGAVLFDNFNPPSAHTAESLGLGGNGYNHPVPTVEIGHADGLGADGHPFVPHLPEGAAGPAINVENPAYNIPHGGGGLEMFHNLGLSDEQWKQHAPELLKQFPDTLYAENGDIRFVSEGVQPLDFRKAVAAITNS